MQGQPPTEVLALLNGHQEALILILDADAEAAGESTIACFMKLEKQSRLSAYLPNLLKQLLQTSSAKASCSQT